MSPESPAMVLRFPSSQKVRTILLAVVALFIVTSTAGQFAKYALGRTQLWGLVELSYVDREASIPTWYSSLAWAGAAALGGVIAWARAWQRDRLRYEWAALAATFAALSADEIAGLHEYPIDRLREMWSAGGFFYYAWVIPGAAFVLLFVAAFSRFLWYSPADLRRRLCLAGFVFVAGALGVEMVSDWWADGHGEENLVYALIITLEEACEMIGVVLLIHALHRTLEQEFPGLCLTSIPVSEPRVVRRGETATPRQPVPPIQVA